MSIDLRPYPRTEKCALCGKVDVDVISPADWDGQICLTCGNEIIGSDAMSHVVTMADLLQWEEEHGDPPL